MSEPIKTRNINEGLMWQGPVMIVWSVFLIALLTGTLFGMAVASL